MKSKTFSPSNKRKAAVIGSALILAINAACGQAQVKETIIEGKQFAHYVRLPSGFKDTGGVPFEHYVFRLNPQFPDVLLLAGCRYETPSGQNYEIEVCSTNSFAIDAAHSYAPSEMDDAGWRAGVPIQGFFEMEAPWRRTLKADLEKPRFLTPLPIDAQGQRTEGHVVGFAYRGKEYRRRADWADALTIGSSPEGRLIVLAGYSRGHLYSPGVYTLDMFGADQSRRIAALDVDYSANGLIGEGVEDRLRQVSLVNSRWVVMGLEYPALRNILLFDFKPIQGDRPRP